MASLRKLPNSPYWIACFGLPDGSRTQRSTRVSIDGVRNGDLKPLQKTLSQLIGAEVDIPNPPNGSGFGAREAKQLAQRIADQFEESVKEAKAARMTEVQARKVISSIYELANKENLQSSTIRDYCQSWLKAKELSSNDRTHERYKGAIDHFLKFMGSRANRDISHLTTKEVAGVRDHMAKTLSANSANYVVKVLRAMLNQAHREKFVTTNEAARIVLIERGVQFERRAFTVKELKEILEVANNEWRGMILVGLYSGLRLGDIALLTWANIDLQEAELKVVTQKTGRKQILPIAKPLLEYLESLPSSDNPNSPVFPKAFECKERNPHGGPLSNQFYNILVAAGMMPKRSHKSQDKGRDTKRQLNAISFHSLRHTATTFLKQAGISDGVVRDIIGHDSAAVNNSYTHIDHSTKAAALGKLPDITK